MILTSVIIAATVIIGVGLVAAFWNDILSYLKKAIQKVAEIIHTAVLGVKVFLKKTSDGIIQVTKYYSQNQETKKWKESINRRKIDEDKVPTEMKQRLTLDQEFDITEELEMQMCS